MKLQNKKAMSFELSQLANIIFIAVVLILVIVVITVVIGGGISEQGEKIKNLFG